MINVEEAKKLLCKHNKDIEEAQKFYWFYYTTENDGFKEAEIEELIKESAKDGRGYVKIYEGKITNLGKSKLKEYGFTVVDLYNYQRTTIPYNNIIRMLPTYVICLYYSVAMDIINYYVTTEDIKRESIKIY